MVENQVTPDVLKSWATEYRDLAAVCYTRVMDGDLAHLVTLRDAVWEASKYLEVMAAMMESKTGETLLADFKPDSLAELVLLRKSA